ncbi:MAG TPA: D-xylose ABC transporter ATP-binding protein, partial [Microbacterium ginsengisoli]|nr:D-xylose ABC transporter ATP-binding protein [Microbacterium ginsengisoli]
LLIMDEPTAALSGIEVERLFTIARSLRDEGRALIFISHRFDEVFALCDTVTVMRDGAYIATSAIADTTVDAIVRQMVGREITELFPKQPAEIGEPLL